VRRPPPWPRVPSAWWPTPATGSSPCGSWQEQTGSGPSGDRSCPPRWPATTGSTPCPRRGQGRGPRARPRSTNSGPPQWPRRLRAALCWPRASPAGRPACWWPAHLGRRGRESTRSPRACTACSPTGGSSASTPAPCAAWTPWTAWWWRLMWSATAGSRLPAPASWSRRPMRPTTWSSWPAMPAPTWPGGWVSTWWSTVVSAGGQPADPRGGWLRGPARGPHAFAGPADRRVQPRPARRRPAPVGGPRRRDRGRLGGRHPAGRGGGGRPRGQQAECGSGTRRLRRRRSSRCRVAPACPRPGPRPLPASPPWPPSPTRSGAPPDSASAGCRCATRGRPGIPWRSPRCSTCWEPLPTASPGTRPRGGWRSGPTRPTVGCAWAGRSRRSSPTR
jgi:hypothetical protein